MNKKQLEYALDRVKKIHAAKVSALTPPPPKRLTAINMVKALKSGAFKVLEHDDSKYYYNDIREFIAFDEERLPEDKKALAAIEQLNKQYIKICDELNLGDASVALEMIRSFEGWNSDV